MKRLRILALSIMLCFSFTVSSFSITTLELSEKLEPVEAEVTQNIENSKANLLDKAYPVGSVYTTTENMSAADMHQQFGGTWVPIKDTFLWAKDADNAHVTRNTGVLGATGGMRNYNLSAVIGPGEDDELAFIPYSTSQYMMKPYSYSFRGITFNTLPAEESTEGMDGGDDTNTEGTNNEPQNTDNTETEETYIAEGSFSGSIPVTEQASANRTTEIMPPYLVVKMFKRIS